MKKNGFTLLELVIVIVILGILSVVAAPKFLSIQKDAKISALHGLEAAIKGGISIIYSKSILSGKDNQALSIFDYNGSKIVTFYGYPRSDSLSYLISGLEGLTNIGFNNDFGLLYQTRTGDENIAIYGLTSVYGNSKGVFDENTKCSVTYKVYIGKRIPPSVSVNDEC